MPAMNRLASLQPRVQRLSRQLSQVIHERPRLCLGIAAGAVVVLLMLTLLGGPGLVDQAREIRADGQLDQYADLLRHHAQRTGISEQLIRTIVRAESSGRARAVSPIGARGLMQITAITEKDVRQRNPELRAGDLFDPDYNLEVGTTYLAYLLERFDGDLTLALMAYHMGPTAVRRGQAKHPRLNSAQLLEAHGGPQTRAYVKKILTGVVPG